jgi:hypothetical protein
MLSYEDERRLAAIERQLISDYPALARRFARPARTAGSRWGRVLVAVIGILCLFAMLVGLLAGSTELVVSGAVLTAAASWSLHQLRRTRR